MRLTNQQFKFVCEILWGGVPVDKEWAEQTSIFISNAPIILKRYPLLDKSI